MCRAKADLYEVAVHVIGANLGLQVSVEYYGRMNGDFVGRWEVISVEFTSDD